MRHLTIPHDIPTKDLKVVPADSMSFDVYFRELMKPYYPASVKSNASVEEFEVLMSTVPKFAARAAGDVVHLTDDEYAALVATVPLVAKFPHLDTLLDRTMVFRLAIAQAIVVEDEDEKKLKLVDKDEK